MKLLSFLYIAASKSHTCVHYFSSCHTFITFLNMLPLIFFSREVKNVGECCQASAVSLC